jgi:hypothetical protein
MMTYFGDFRCSDYLTLDTLIEAINASFSGALDTLQWGTSLNLKGVRPLVEVYLLQPSSVSPMQIEARPASEIDIMERIVPSTPTLEQNYPNPFNPTTTISFSLSEPSLVSLTIYDMLGREMSVVLDHVYTDEGSHEVEYDAGGISSGLYFYRLTSEAISLEGARSVQMRKMILLK